MTSVGLFGLPGSGKSTVFTALTHQAVHPQFLGMDLKPNVAVAKIPDVRLDRLGEFYRTRSIVHATMEFVDIPGFDPASTEAKLKNAVLEHYRKCDALALIVNLFDPGAASAAAAGVNALLEELVLLGLVTTERILPRLEKAAQPKAAGEERKRLEAVQKVHEALEAGTPVRRLELEEGEHRLIREYAFLSALPVLLVLNVSEADYGSSDGVVAGLQAVLDLAAAEGLDVLRLSAALEAELASLEEQEAAEFLAEYGLSEPALPRFIRAAFDTLGLITFLTGSEKECRSWALRRGSTAQQAAGSIHSDMARGFIRAETVAWRDFEQHGGMAGAKSAGRMRLEGKDYIVQDGDILSIRFNV